ncbi:ATP-binding protein [Flexithrix dorotheae]|uniref:ATP-binding protein n=1 Tax=Flexithrix dorotheae TaxID=70993 RepID=UPI000374502D|nr:ATP-binding protein [Flexithrix dorotheae]
MKIAKLVDYFIGEWRFQDIKELRRSRLLVRACLLTSLFSNSYIWFSVFYEFEKGVYLMISNVVGFLLLPFFLKTRIPALYLGNVFIFIGSFAVIVLAIYSGGVFSAIYPWIIATPVLALLVVNRLSGIIWGGIAFLTMIILGIFALNGIELPIEYNQSLKTELYISVIPGLLLIILFISFVFENMQRKALEEVESKNIILNRQKETIIQQSSELEKLVNEKDTIIRILAHDLRSPLNNILGLTNLLKTDQNTPSERYIDLILESTVNAQDLIDKVLKMDAIEQKGLEIKWETTNLQATIEHVLGRIKEQAEKKRINIRINDQADNALVKTDDTYLKLVLENLLSNAIKFSLPDTTVMVDILKMDAQLQVKIIDNGQGIRPEEEGKLFKKFSKLTSRPTAGETSTGLGLSLVKRYAELIEADVWYEPNKTGNGATFVVGLKSLEKSMV